MLSASPAPVEISSPQTPKRSVIIHPAYKLGSGGRTQALSCLAALHNKVLVFCPANLVRWHADVFVHEGIPARSAYDASEIGEKARQFDADESGALVLSKGLCNSRWGSTTANCIVISELYLRPFSRELLQMVRRAGRLSEVHIIGCQYIGFSTSSPDVAELFGGLFT